MYTFLILLGSLLNIAVLALATLFLISYMGWAAMFIVIPYIVLTCHLDNIYEDYLEGTVR